MEFTGPKPADVSRQSKPIIERRRGVRHRVHSPAYATLNGTSPAKTLDLSEILDISEHGMSIQTSSPLETDHDLDMALDLSETRARIGTAGRVVWSDSSGRAGIRFPKLSGESLRQLKEWFFVNILTAYDHARAWTRSAETDESNATGSGSLLSLDLRQNEVASRTPEFPRNGGSLAESDTIHAQMKSGNNREAALQAIADQALSLTHAAGAAIAKLAFNRSKSPFAAASFVPAASAAVFAVAKAAFAARRASALAGNCLATGSAAALALARASLATRRVASCRLLSHPKATAF